MASSATQLAHSFTNLFSALHTCLRCLINNVLTLVVLGMHRSGTSCITRIIGLNGAEAGDNIIGATESNRCGHWEHLRAHRLNENILRMSSGSWENPPTEVRATLQIRLRMLKFLSTLHSDQRTAVWKDPRTVLTFPVWKPLMMNYMPVVVFRHPMSVACSLEKRDQFSIAKGLHLWTEYNQRILDIVDAEDRVLYIDFDGGLDHIRSQMKRLTQIDSQLQYDPASIEFYDEGLRTADERTKIPDEEAKRIYVTLRDFASTL